MRRLLHRARWLGELNQGLGRSKTICLETRSFSHSSDAVQKPTQVLLTHLPTTVTYDDIRNLCYTPKYSGFRAKPRKSDDIAGPEDVMDEASPSAEPAFDHVHGSNQKFSSKSEPSPLAMLRDISTIRLFRSAYFSPRGKALVSFHGRKHAMQFVKTVDNHHLSGHVIRAKVDFHPNEALDLEERTTNGRLLRLLQEHSPGRVVLLKGLPQMNEDRLQRMLVRTYTLAMNELTLPPSSSSAGRNESMNPREVVGPVVKLRNLTPNSATGSFLVRLETVSDAMRLVRKWHRQPWASEGRLQQRDEEADEGDEGEQESDESRVETERLVEMERKLNLIPFIIDAQIMY